MPARAQIVPLDQLDGLIHLVRGQKVMLDSDLAGLYGVPTKVLNQAVRRNAQRFPEDFMFQLAAEEAEQILRSQIVTTSSIVAKDISALRKGSEQSLGVERVLRSQFVTSKTGSGGRRYRPFAFTEQGVAMLSSVLHSPRAIQVNIEIMRAFVRLRQWLSSNAELASRLTELEKKYDHKFKVIFDVIRELMDAQKPARPRREIGFHAARGQLKPVSKSRPRKPPSQRA